MAYAETELAWAAGFFDGEGCTMLNRSGRFPTMIFDLGQVDRRPLDRFLAAVGVGKVYGPYSHGRGSSSLMHHYRATGPAVATLLLTLWKYLSPPKREQAYAKALEWYNERARSGVWRGRTRCAHGHRLVGDNLAWSPSGELICRECNRVKALAYYHRSKR